ncbi:MAG: Rpn family recombination-promoting nuclease/putative transposase, partial [Spirochaetaceae bacterium]|nr:Rpn family recombination-promoting nuclease/putative transposase [Spirochaetaceae bacterium]
TPKGSEYSDLKQNYVIFICTFDPFHCGKAMYHFANYCINHDFPIPLEDGTSKLFLNTAAKALDSLDGDLRLFYDYVRERTTQTTFTKELDNSISKLKQEKEERSMYLTYTSRMMECRRDGYEEGLHTGREEGISIGLERGAYQNKLETARNFLSEGLAPAMVARCTDLPLETVLELIQKR